MTGVEQEGCYLSFTKNCGGGLTREHQISQNLIKKIPGRFAVRGFPGADPTVDVIVPVEVQGSKVLCKRHNEALSPLDDQAGKMFARLYPSTQFLTKRRYGAALTSRWVFIDAPKLEAWSAKVLAGTHAAGLVRMQGIKHNQPLDYNKMRAAIERGEFENGAGMYVLADPNANEHGLQYRPHISNGVVVGIHMNLARFSFLLIIDAEFCDFRHIYSQPHTYRPSVHRLYGDGGETKLFLSSRQRPNPKNVSQGRVIWTSTGSSSAAPFDRLQGPPEVDDRTRQKSKP
ncbi:hypothetical protein [Bradyrhizobium sp. JYMT SZCCT0180]|uniref:hypothetical protein n=1 Tax=Bradyrhizobium sp. JYMT SZCCT0180 TaxID=2807666 RepID=UPI001BAB6A0B|nr:hypothetical protein [Bradyrhizobium sp. JYMT SZCCT0180]